MRGVSEEGEPILVGGASSSSFNVDVQDDATPRRKHGKLAQQRLLLIVTGSVLAVVLGISVVLAVLGSGTQSDDDLQENRPRFHLIPSRGGWMNDPNGLYYLRNATDPSRGTYHVFYQLNPRDTVWQWDHVQWGHFTAPNLYQWAAHRPTLPPSEDGFDCSGSWSGCMGVDSTGAPALLYTGVARKDRQCRNSQPTAEVPEYNRDMEHREVVMLARPKNPDDPLLIQWTPSPEPLIAGPPPLLPNSTAWEGWRDPYLTTVRGPGGEWILLMGAGAQYDGQLHGLVLLYTSATLSGGWQYRGPALTIPGFHMAEVPFMLDFSTPQLTTGRHVMGFSADRYQDVHPESGIRPVFYFTGTFNSTSLEFSPDRDAPIQLDLGDRLYAANTMIGAAGETILIGWIQECQLKSTIVHSSWYPEPAVQCREQGYAGCLSSPRVLEMRDGWLHQRIHPDLLQLRAEEPFFDSAGKKPVVVAEEGEMFVLPLDDVHVMLDLALTPKTEGANPRCSIVLDRTGERMLLQYNWGATLKAAVGTHDELHSVNLFEESKVAGLRHFGGALHDPALYRHSLVLQILSDGSVVEVFLLAGGETLTTRSYQHTGYDRLRPAQLEVSCVDGGPVGVQAKAWAMRSIITGTTPSA